MAATIAVDTRPRREDRLFDVVRRHREERAEEIVEAVRGEVSRFAGRSRFADRDQRGPRPDQAAAGEDEEIHRVADQEDGGIRFVGADRPA